MTNNTDKETVVIRLEGRIDSGNSEEVRQSIREQLEGKGDVSIILDASELLYLSSAGLRVLLHLIKQYKDVRIAGANSDIYGILEMTGFTEMVPVDKYYQNVSIEDCEVLGEGANGTVYKIQKDYIVKTFKGDDALEEIERQREVSRLALILGIPTAISFDVVRVGDGYGAIYELLDAKSFSQILASEAEKMDWCVEEYVDLLRTVHSTVVPDGKLPAIKEKGKSWVSGMKGFLTEELGEKIERMVNDIPERNTMIHGDYHTKNVVLAGGEVLLVDMDTLSTGHPIYDLGQMYSSFIGFGEYNHEVTSNFQKVDPEILAEFWRRSLRAYLGTDDEKTVKDAEDRIRCLSYVRLIDWNRRHRDPGTDEDRATRKLWIEELTELLGHVDTLELSL